jgi:hypothetical protein
MKAVIKYLALVLLVLLVLMVLGMIFSAVQ